MSILFFISCDMRLDFNINVHNSGQRETGYSIHPRLCHENVSRANLW